MTSIGGGITTTGNMARQLEMGINAITNTYYNDYEPEWTKILDLKTSSKNFETDVPQGTLGLAKVKPEGQGIEYDSIQEGASKIYFNVNYALGIIITEEAIEDNLYLPLMEYGAKSLKRSLTHTEEQVSANVFNNGYDPAFTGWDGQPLFSNVHTNIKSSAPFSNVLPTPADLSEASLEDALLFVQNFKDDAGLLIDARVKSLHIPRQLSFIADRILSSPLQNDTSLNAINSIKNRGLIAGGFHVNHRFINQKDWFLRTDVENGGKFFRRKAQTFKTDNDFGTDNYRHKGTTRFSVGVTDFRQYMGSGANV